LQTSNLILDFEFDQHLESHKHVISIIMGFRDTGCYRWCDGFIDMIREVWASSTYGHTPMER
jgi:hypothetical protein